jgi:general L-amino acid transport system permease protein
VIIHLGRSLNTASRTFVNKAHHFGKGLMQANKNLPALQSTTPFWRDERVLQILWQVIFVIGVAGFGYFLLNNMFDGLQKQGTVLGLNFLSQTSGFDISEPLIEYSRSSTYLRAFFVGLLNTLLVSFLGIIFSTILGIILGVARLSTNFIINRLAAIYLELIRNIPLLVFLIFWYTGVFLTLPRVQSAIILPGPIFLTNRGVAIPWGMPTETFKIYLWVMLAGLVIAGIVAFLLTQRGKQTGRMPLVTLWAPLTWILIVAVGWFVLPVAPLRTTLPFVSGFNMDGGLVLSPELMALLSALVLYTAAFIGEVVRAGIQAVPHGQMEASRALGLTNIQALRLVIFPQALRVIIPPLTSQYLNLTKNSSLAVAIAYPDVFYVSNTIQNQTGRAVEMISLVMLVYLTFSLITSVFMNWYNSRIQLAER